MWEHQKGLARAKGLSQVDARTLGAKSGAEYMTVCVLGGRK